MTQDKLLSILKGAVIALLGGGLVACLQYLQAVDWGWYAPLIASALSIAINAARKALEPAAPALPPPPPPAGGNGPFAADWHPRLGSRE